MLRGEDIEVVDFFSLDVEGAELNVLLTMDWKVPVRVWLIENDEWESPKNDQTRRLLAQHGYATPLRGGNGFNSSSHNLYFFHRDLLGSVESRLGHCGKCRPLV